MAKTILLADDSVTIRKVVELTFSDTDIRVESVGNGQEALAKLATVLPDLVLADVAMPSPSGYEICEEVKSSQRPVPVLLLAGTFEPFDRERARACGADGHLVKPFESTVLIERVEALLSPAPEPVVETQPQTAQAPPPPDEGELEAALDSLAADTGADSRGAPAARPEKEQDPPEVSASLPPEERPVAAAPSLTSDQLDVIARAVVERLSSDVLREIVWEIVPDLAESIIRERIRELEREVEG